MKNLFVCCLVSALVGGAMAAWLVTEHPGVWPGSSTAHAQESFGDASH